MSERTAAGQPAVTLVATPPQEVPVGAAGAGVHVYFDVHTWGLDPAALGGGPDAAEVIIVDCSGSMGAPHTKIAAAQDAAEAAVDALRAGTAFAVVQGTHRAEMAYPAQRHLVRADHDTRAQARARIRYLFPSGGTTIGAWLGLARELLDSSDAEVRHAVLLTDGHNVADPGLLRDELACCEGRFVCDARGVGSDWDARELKQIADRLHGTASAVLNDSDLAAEFGEMVRRSMARTLPGLTLRITLSPGSRIRFFKQVHPFERDLTAEGRPAGGRSVDFPTPAWASDENRQYHLCLEVEPPGADALTGEPVQLAYAEVVLGTDRVRAPQPAPVLVLWHDRDEPGTELGPVGEHFQHHDDLARAIAEAYQAFEDGDRPRAEREFGKAVRAALALRDDYWLGRLGTVVRVLDAEAGRVALHPDLDPRAVGLLLMLSTHSGPAPGFGPAPPEGPGSPGGPGSARGGADPGGPGRPESPRVPDRALMRCPRPECAAAPCPPEARGHPACDMPGAAPGNDPPAGPA